MPCYDMQGTPQEALEGEMTVISLQCLAVKSIEWRRSLQRPSNPGFLVSCSSELLLPQSSLHPVLTCTQK